MLTLAFDTATEQGSVCLYSTGESVLGEVCLSGRKRHSEVLLQAVDFLLRSAGTRISEIDFFTISIGPGSYTGLRVGLSTVKGLCFATGRPLVTVSTLESLALTVTPTAWFICPLLDARKREVYGAVYRYHGGTLSTVMDEAVGALDLFIRDLEDDTVFLGSGASVYRKQILERLKDKAHFRPAPVDRTLASTVAYLGIKKAERGEFSDPTTTVPRYLRASEAEEKLKTRI